MTPDELLKRWPCELRPFILPKTTSLPDKTASFMRDVGFPRFFEVNGCNRSVFHNKTKRLSECFAAKYNPLPCEVADWLVIGDCTADVGELDSPAFYCLNDKGEVHDVYDAFEHGVITNLVSLSVWDMSECMLRVIEWHQLTSGSLRSGESVMRLLRLFDRHCFSLSPNKEPCSVCFSAQNNSIDHFLSGNCCSMFSSDCNGADYFPEQLDVLYG